MKVKELWFRQLGFYSNPFSIKPAAFYDELMGYDTIVKKVNNSIETRKIVYVEGDYGYGKSTLLRRILNRFGGKGKVIYFSCNRIESSLNINKLLSERYGIFGKLFNMKAKEMILLLDEAQWLPREDYSRIVRYYRAGYFKSIVFVGKEYDINAFDDGVRNQVMHVKLGEITPDDAVRIVRKRVGHIPILSDEQIKQIFRKSGQNVRKLLKYSEFVCKTAVENDEDFATQKLIEEALGGEEISEEPEETKADEIIFEEKKSIKRQIDEEKAREEIIASSVDTFEALEEEMQESIPETEIPQDAGIEEEPEITSEEQEETASEIIEEPAGIPEETGKPEERLMKDEEEQEIKAIMEAVPAEEKPKAKPKERKETAALQEQKPSASTFEELYY